MDAQVNPGAGLVPVTPGAGVGAGGAPGGSPVAPGAGAGDADTQAKPGLLGLRWPATAKGWVVLITALLALAGGGAYPFVGGGSGNTGQKPGATAATAPGAAPYEVEAAEVRGELQAHLRDTAGDREALGGLKADVGWLKEASLRIEGKVDRLIERTAASSGGSGGGSGGAVAAGK